MNKKIKLLIMLAVLIIVPATRVNATQVYVGVQVTHATAPGYPSGTTNPNWCLPAGYIPYNYETQMAILTATDDSCYYIVNNYSADTVESYCSNSVAPIAPSTNPVYVKNPVCANNTIWSGLLDLTSSTDYRVYLYTPNFCSGYYSANGHCLEAAGTGKSCDEICSHYGQTTMNGGGESYCYTYGDTTDCTAVEALKGSPCTTCSAGSYNYYDADGNCWYNYGGYEDCTYSAPSLTRVCACQFQGPATGFLFPFTASGF